ncbi:hypothetical protein [Nocardia sp. NPDC005366]|uniref:EGFR-like transmembrane domain-containing protein n=1 Tax=Nocardia sp. NPDC005366 TaxID=3156878 RepID=UPI0033B254DD
MSTDDADTADTADNTDNTDKAEDAAGTADAVTEGKAETEEATAKPDLAKATAKAPEEKQAPRTSPPAKAAATSGSSPTPIIAAFVAGILLVAAITAVVVFYLQAQNRGDELAAVEDSTHAACAFGRNVSTYDYSKDLDGYFKTVKEGATGDFLKEFDDASKALSEAMVQAQVKSWVDDVQCGHQSGDSESAKVLVTLTQFRTNFSQTTPDRQYVVVIADLKNEGGDWKVSKLDSPMLRGSGTGLPGGASATPGATPAPAPAPGN